MLGLSNYLGFLWNGGLDPSTAGLIELRERRILSATILLLWSVSFIVIITNTASGVAADNAFLIAGQISIFAALFIQAHLNSHLLAANAVIFSFWVALTGIMQSYGLQGTYMMWLMPIPAIALLLTNSTNGLVWAGICSTTLVVYGFIHQSGALHYNSPFYEYVPSVGLGNAVEGVLLITILTGTALIFRKAQHDTEIEFTKLVSRLETEVHSRTLAEEDAKQSEQSKTAFLSAMSHEIRTPLNGVITATRLLVRAKNDDDREEFSDIVLESSNTLLELVSDVMDLAAMESGKFKIANNAYSIRDLIVSTLRPFKFQAEEKGIELEMEISPLIPDFIVGDSTRAKQIIINLVGNAIKFTHKGLVKLTLTVELNKLKLVVEDSGIGIPPRAQKKLFEPFVQADVTTRGSYGGSGLGLTIVKKIVSAINGNITVESTPGEGTKISVYSPLIESDKTIYKQTDLVTPDITLASLNLLVADDNAVNRMVLSRLLEHDNHKVVSVVDGKQALDYVKAHLVDAVLMDIQMPIMDGEQAAASIRSLSGAQRDVPIIAITANTSREDAERLLNSHFNGFVAKPFKHEELMQTLQRVCIAERD